MHPSKSKLCQKNVIFRFFFQGPLNCYGKALHGSTGGKSLLKKKRKTGHLCSTEHPQWFMNGGKILISIFSTICISHLSTFPAWLGKLFRSSHVFNDPVNH